MTIQEIQETIMRTGWQFTEHVYNDGMFSNCSIEFTKDQSPHALSTYPRPADCVGWGRFTRTYAWQRAYNWLILGIKEDQL